MVIIVTFFFFCTDASFSVFNSRSDVPHPYELASRTTKNVLFFSESLGLLPSWHTILPQPSSAFLSLSTCSITTISCFSCLVFFFFQFIQGIEANAHKHNNTKETRFSTHIATYLSIEGIDTRLPPFPPPSLSPTLLLSHVKLTSFFFCYFLLRHWCWRW